MTNIDLVKVLLAHIGDVPGNDMNIAKACIILLGDATPKAEPVKKAAAASTATKPAGRKSRVDHGKICACYKAGWDITKIADEIGCDISTVRYHLKKEGLIK